MITVIVSSKTTGKVHIPFNIKYPKGENLDEGIAILERMLGKVKTRFLLDTT